MTQETLIQMELTVSGRDRDPVTAYLFQEVPYGWEEREAGDGGAVFRIHAENQSFADILVQAVQARWPGVEVCRETVAKRDWALAWREFFTAVPAGEDFIVIAPWMADEQPFPDRIPIIIEPKTAFGTGHHPTTALCLEVVSGLFRRGRVGKGMRFLDLGTGSGILGLGAAKLGLSGVGVDIDPLAEENARENKEINRVGEAFQVHVGSVEVLDGLVGDERFDLVLANILAEPLISLAPEIVARLKPGGCLVLSGLLDIQREQVARAYVDLGMAEPGELIQGEWAALVWDGTAPVASQGPRE